jgi:putative ABC transport system permease protein
MWKDILIQAYEALKFNRRRSVLTMLSMAWGIATVVLLLAYGTGMGRAFSNIWANFGAKCIIVFGGRTSTQAGGAKAGVAIRLERDDVDRIANGVPLTKHVSPEVNFQTKVQFSGRSFDLPISGSYPELASVRALDIESGHFYTADDLNQRARVAIIGSEAKTKLFSGQFALGESIRINGISFTVIGVGKPKMQEGNDDINRIIYIPYSTMGDLRDIKYPDAIWISYESDQHEKVVKGIREVLATAHKFDPSDRRAVNIADMMEQIQAFNIITIMLQVFLSIIGALTMGIGGVGLMNIMLVSVTQRTREIGVEKALGASRRAILIQFLAEAMAITFAGGLLGIVMAYVISFSVGNLTFYSAIAKNAEAADIRLLISPISLVVSTGILIVVGLISGMIPAIRASKLDPIEALRYE